MIQPLPSPLPDSAQPQGTEATLDALLPGESARIVAVDAEGSLRRHLLEMGFTPGCPVTYFMGTPFRDPKVFLLRGTHIALRRQEARCVRVAT